jgi:hypothetical protein
MASAWARHSAMVEQVPGDDDPAIVCLVRISWVRQLGDVGLLGMEMENYLFRGTEL